MRKVMSLAAAMLPLLLFAQLGIGLKAGLNFANVTNASSINSSSQSGFMAGIFLAPQSKSIIASRTELIYSRQGYSYKSNTNTGNVNLDYILLPQLMGINITKFVQIQIGAQMAFLINAKVDSSGSSGSSSNPYGKLLDYYNRFDYGFAGGVEIHPVMGLLIGARYNLSLGNIYKDPTTVSQGGGTPTPTDFIPKVDAKNNVVQIFVGWIFGGNKSSKEKQKEKEKEKQ
jgi:hypothetical protein